MRTDFIRLARGMAVVAWLFATVFVTGCSLEFSPDTLLPIDDGNGGGGGGNYGIDPEAGGDSETVVVRFLNLTLTEAVNVEFYATNAPATNLPDDLFDPTNLVTASIGVAGTGIVQPGHADAIEFPCTEDLVLGTNGGLFVDNETGTERGVGDRRWGQKNQLGLCGSIVTFEFAIEGESFVTRLRLGD